MSLCFVYFNLKDYFREDKKTYRGKEDIGSRMKELDLELM